MHETDLKGDEKASFDNEKSDEKQFAENVFVLLLWTCKRYLMDNLKKLNSKSAIVSAMNFLQYIIINAIIIRKNNSYS